MRSFLLPLFHCRHKTRMHIGQLVKDTSAKLKQASETDHGVDVSVRLLPWKPLCTFLLYISLAFSYPFCHLLWFHGTQISYFENKKLNHANQSNMVTLTYQNVWSNKFSLKVFSSPIPKLFVVIISPFVSGRQARKSLMLNLPKTFKQFWRSFRRLSGLQLRGRHHILLLFPRQYFLLGNPLFLHWRLWCSSSGYGIGPLVI